MSHDRDRMEHLRTLLEIARVAGRVMFYTGLFLLLLELMALVGADATSSRIADFIAILFTIGLIVLSLCGSRVMVYVVDRVAKRAEGADTV